MSSNGGGTGGSALRARAAARHENGADEGTAPGTQIATRAEAPVTSLRTQIDRMEVEFAKAMPAGQAAQFVRDAVTCLQVVDKLDRCDARSVLGALMNCAQLGLRPALLGHAWPLPFWDKDLEVKGPDGKPRKGGYRAQLIIGYLGYTHLAYESGQVKSAKAVVVRDADEFDWDEGSDDPPIHKRPRFGKPRGPVIGYYATVSTTLGGTLVYAMDVPDMLAFRDEYARRGKSPRDGVQGPIVGPWAGAVDSRNFTGMAKKTVLRYCLKTAPRSSQLARADAVDESVRIDTSALSEPAAVSRYVAIEQAPEPGQPPAAGREPREAIVITREQRRPDDDPPADPYADIPLPDPADPQDPWAGKHP